MPPHPSVELVACLHDGGRAGGLAAAVVDLERRLVDPHADRRRPLVHPHPDGHREPRRRRGHVLRRGGRAAADAENRARHTAKKPAGRCRESHRVS
jgi:hypothetical protein